MGTTAEKLTYLNTTKTKIKDGINRLGGELTNLSTFRSYETALNNIYDTLPKVSDTGSNLSLSPTLKGALGTIPLGNCEQTGTPTPDTPQPIKVVTGENQVVVSNKNLFDGEIEYGSINPSNGNLVNSTTRTRSTNFTKVSPNTTYTITRTNTISAFLWIVGYNSNKQGITDGLIDNPSGIAQTPSTYTSSLTFTTTATTEYIKWYQTNSGGGLNEHIQIEVGSTATSYVPHAEQSYTLHLGSNYLAGIGDYKDKIVKDGDSWKIRRKIRKVTLNGSEDWNYFPNIASSNLYRIAFSGYQKNVICYSNYYKGIASTGGRTNFTIYLLETTGSSNLDILDNRYTSADDFKTWLSTHNTTVYYVLATPTEETITDTALINELNELQELLSYNGTTNITITSNSNNAQMLAQVSALKGE